MEAALVSSAQFNMGQKDPQRQVDGASEQSWQGFGEVVSYHLLDSRTISLVNADNKNVHITFLSPLVFRVQSFIADSEVQFESISKSLFDNLPPIENVKLVLKKIQEPLPSISIATGKMTLNIRLDSFSLSVKKGEMMVQSLQPNALSYSQESTLWSLHCSKEYRYFGDERFLLAMGAAGACYAMSFNAASLSAARESFCSIAAAAQSEIVNHLSMGVTAAELDFYCILGHKTAKTGNQPLNFIAAQMAKLPVAHQALAPWSAELSGRVESVFGEAADPELHDFREGLSQLVSDMKAMQRETGLPVFRGLYWNNAIDIHQPLGQSQFFIGPDVLCAPLSQEEGEHREVFLPSDNDWYVYHPKQPVLGPATPGDTQHAWYAPTGLLPVYVREGGIIASRQAANAYNVSIYPGQDSEYCLYQFNEGFLQEPTTEAATGSAKQAGRFRKTHFVNQSVATGRELSIRRLVDDYPRPAAFFCFRFLLTDEPSTVLLGKRSLQNMKNEQALQGSAVSAYYYDVDLKTVVVKWFDTQKKVKIAIKPK